MIDPVKRVRRGASLMGIVLLVSIIGYHELGYDWLESVWMTTVTISSVGYGEDSAKPPHHQVFTIVVILVGMSAAAYTFGGFIQLLTQGEIEKILGRRKMDRSIERLKNHVVICGFGRMGKVLAEELEHYGKPFVIIEENSDRVIEASEKNYLVVTGNATEDDVLISAGIQQASTLVCGLPNDAANVFITLTGRDLNRDLHIISRAEHKSTERKLIQAGVNKTVLPTMFTAQQMSRMILRPSTADLIELFAGRDKLDVELDEFLLGSESPLVDMTVQQIEDNRRRGILVVALKPKGGSMIFNPDNDHTIQEFDTIIVMGRTTELKAFIEKYHLVAAKV